ncbi:MAG: hypothetical protein AAGF87_17800 [Bacteroidota bacterium]
MAVYRFCILTFFALLASSPVLAAQPIHPKAKATLEEKFPAAEFVEWAAFDEGYCVSFFDPISDRAAKMEFDEKGRWQQTTLDYDTADLSPEIMAYVDANFEQYYSTAYELRTRRKRKSRYGLVIDTPTHIHTLIFREDGRLLEEEMEGLDGG